MKKRKSLHGFLADKNNPISMKEIVEELRRDRRESDERRERVFDALLSKKNIK